MQITKKHEQLHFRVWYMFLANTFQHGKFCLFNFLLFQVLFIILSYVEQISEFG